MNLNKALILSSVLSPAVSEWRGGELVKTPKDKATRKRRAKNKTARKSRKANRR